MIRNAYVIMTALVPTIGHAALVEFARNVASKQVIVAVQGRSFEPVPTWQRTKAFVDYFTDGEGQIFFHTQVDDNAPQNPDPAKETYPGADKEFWEYWANSIRKLPPWFMVGPQDAIVASEPYGAVLAQYLGCQFVPYDIARAIVDVKGSTIRSCISENWDCMLPTFRKNLQLNFVMFGQESVGKTTLAKELTYCFTDSKFIPEYAREYLETVGSEITSAKMNTIEQGQWAFQLAAYSRANQINFFDTDLLSTIGYYRIFENRMDDTDKNNDKMLHQELTVRQRAVQDKMHYILLNDDIAFEEDELRYGGNKRQSSYVFWKNLLDQYGCRYSTLPKGMDLSQKIDYIASIVEEEQNRLFDPISDFERE